MGGMGYVVLFVFMIIIGVGFVGLFGYMGYMGMMSVMVFQGLLSFIRGLLFFFCIVLYLVVVMMYGYGGGLLILVVLVLLLVILYMFCRYIMEEDIYVFGCYLGGLIFEWFGFLGMGMGLYEWDFSGGFVCVFYI